MLQTEACLAFINTVFANTQNLYLTSFDLLLRQQSQCKITTRFQKSFSNSTYYRSIRYKVNSTTISIPSSIQKLPFKQTIRQVDSLNHKLNSLTAQKVEKFKRYSTLQNQQRQPSKMSYLQTWRTLLDKISLKGQDCNIELKSHTVALPTIKQCESSQFTTLDPLTLPIQYVRNEIRRIANELPGSKEETSKLKTEMLILKRNIQADLDQTNQTIFNGLTRLKHLITMDRVQEQEMKLRKKRECFDLLSSDQSIKQHLETAKERIAIIQEAIFQTKPFQLQRTLDQSNPEQTQYF